MQTRNLNHFNKTLIIKIFDAENAVSILRSYRDIVLSIFAQAPSACGRYLRARFSNGITRFPRPARSAVFRKWKINTKVKKDYCDNNNSSNTEPFRLLEIGADRLLVTAPVKHVSRIRCTCLRYLQRVYTYAYWFTVWRYFVRNISIEIDYALCPLTFSWKFLKKSNKIALKF